MKNVNDMIVCNSRLFEGPNEKELPDFKEEDEDSYPDEDEHRDDEVDENGIPYL